MDTTILAVHVLVCVFIILLVLLQSGREGMGVIFGGSNSSNYGSSGASGFLTKLTAVLAVVFIITSLSYNVIISDPKDESSTILDVQFEEVAPPAAQEETSAQ